MEQIKSETPLQQSLNITNPNFKGGKTHFELDGQNHDQPPSAFQLYCNCRAWFLHLYWCNHYSDPESYGWQSGTDRRVDYKIVDVQDGVNVGTATVIIAGVDQNDEGDGIYDPANTVGHNF